MNGISPVKHGFVDLAAVMFVIGGVVSLVMSILTLPIASIYPFTLPSNIGTEFLVVLGITVICSLGAIHCYSLTTKRMLSEAGIRGLIFGALLLIFSLGLVGGFQGSSTKAALNALSAVLILVAGVICFALRHTAISASAIARQHAIAQPAFQA
jgi:small-conductance mechanosensitive channel